MKRPIFIIVNNPLFVAQHLQFLFPYLDALNIFFVTSSPSNILLSKNYKIESFYLYSDFKRIFAIDFSNALYFVFIRLLYRPFIGSFFYP